jgi:aspartyl-tRNA(Asn)/glutamyl-tRNA(Gln) amidotransferase subunit A
MVRHGQATFEGIVRAMLTDIDLRPELNSFVTVNPLALADAIQSDTRAQNQQALPLEGLAIAVKDNISTKDLRTTCASKMLENFIPVYDATVVERLKESGAIIVGKTNLDEFAMGSSGENSFFGPSDHPEFSGYVPGGSSSGSAVAVAAGQAHAALGSDTGGSVRQPAAFCGILGFKPSYGRISRYGLVAFASSLDQIGIFSKDIETMALVFDSISGQDEKDSTCSRQPAAQSWSVLEQEKDIDPSQMHITVLPDEELVGLSADVRAVYDATLRRLSDAGAKFSIRAIPASKAWIPTYYILATAEASSNLARFDGVRYGYRAATVQAGADATVKTRSEGFGREVQRRIMLGTYVLSSGYYDAFYRKAQQARRVITQGYASIFENSDILLLPSTPTTPFKRGEKSADPLAMYLSDYFTVSANLAGIPAISFPAGKNDAGFSIGLQLQAGHFQDEKLLLYTRSIMNLLQ